MENSETQNISPFNTALKWGLILGLSEVVVHLIFFVAGKPITFITTVTYMILLTGFFILGIQSFRDKELGGYISWKRGLGLALLIGLIGAVIYMIYYTTIVSLNRQVFVDATIDKFTKGMEKMKEYISDENAIQKIDDSMDASIEKIKTMSALQFGLNQFVNSLFGILFFALIVPALLKRRDPNAIT